MPRFVVPAAVAIGLLVASAVVQGIWTQRWHLRSANESQEAFAARLKNVPTSFGDWESVEAPIEKRQLDASGAVGSFSRRFMKRGEPDKVVEVFLVCGHPGDMTQHTPDQCYPLAGNPEVEEQQHYVVDTGRTAADFWTNRFRRAAAIANSQQVRVFWSFSSDGKWLAPSIAKYELRGVPALYKIYAITEIRNDGRSRAEESPAVPFLREFVPVLNTVLFPPEGTTPTTSDGSPAAAPSATPAGNPAP